MIRFDFSGCTTEFVGNHGIAKSDLDAIQPLIKKAHDEITSRKSDGRIQFYDLPAGQDVIDQVQALADELKPRFKNVVSLGIGGSSLGPKTLFTALKDALHNLHGEPRLFFFENVDPEYMTSVFGQLDIKETLFIVISKSGTTAEPAAQFMVVLDMLKSALGADFKDNLVFVTDPERGVLRQMAKDEGVRTLDIPPAVGGRFSVMTPVGLFPAAMMDIDINAMMQGASKMADLCLNADIFKNPAYLYGAIHYLALKRGVNISVLMPYSNALYDLADWYRQIWAESLGKKNSLDGKTVHVGQTPVKALGATDQHSQVQLYMEGPYDKIVNVITVDKFRTDLPIPKIMDDVEGVAYLCEKSIGTLINAEARGTMSALMKNERMVSHISIDEINAENMGALFMFFEAATAFAGYLLNIDPFDQPGVELGKVITFGLMGREGYEEHRSEYTPDQEMVIEF